MLENLVKKFPDQSFFKAEGLDEAIIGVEIKSMRLCYSVSKVLDILINDDKMEMDEALDYFEFNVRDSYSGKQTPIWVED